MVELRPENQILLCIAHRPLDRERISQLSVLLRNELDWPYLISSAARHSLIPLLYQHVHSHFESVIPADVMAELTRANRENTNTSLFLTGELVKLLALFDAENIPVIPFKGPVLGISVYGDPSLRQFGDLDLLIRKKDIAKARALLSNHNFRSVPALDPRQQAAVERFECAWNFENVNGAIVDIHWDVIDRYLGVQTKETFWQDLANVSVGGHEYQTLSAENLMIVLCLHGFTHRWERLGWLCDVASLIESHEKLDWQTIVQTATELGIRRILLLGLKLAHELLGAKIPTAVLGLTDAKVDQAAAEVRASLFDESITFSLVSEILFFIKMRERLADRIKSAISLIATPRKFDWMYLSLPASLLSLYYPLRPLRLAAKYATVVIRGKRGTGNKGIGEEGNG